MQIVASLVLEYGVAIIFLNVLLEQAGIPLPTYPTLMIAGALALSGGVGIPMIFIVVLAAAFVADLSWYFAGARHGKTVLALLCRFSLSGDSCVRHAETAFAKFGVRALLFAKFIPGGGPVAAALSGVVGMPLWLFLFLDMLGAIVYLGPPILLGHLFHDAIGPVLSWITRLGLYGALAFMVTAGLWFLLGRRRHPVEPAVLAVTKGRRSPFDGGGSSCGKR
jgi:membrane protein DedA with SNARE-associated domain